MIKKENVKLIMKMAKLRKKDFMLKENQGSIPIIIVVENYGLKITTKMAYYTEKEKFFLKMESLKKKSNLKMDLIYQGLTIKY